MKIIQYYKLIYRSIYGKVGLSVITEKLVKEALAGDTDAVTSLIVAFIPIIRSRIKDGSPDGLETDDLLQEGLIGLVKALEHYDENATAKFTTYATVCIDHQIASALRRASRKKHAALNRFVPLEEDQEADTERMEDELEAREMAQELKSAIDTKLTPLERHILSCFLDGLSYEETAVRLGISKKTVDNGLQRVRRKLKP